MLLSTRVSEFANLKTLFNVLSRNPKARPAWSQMLRDLRKEGGVDRACSKAAAGMKTHSSGLGHSWERSKMLINQVDDV